MGNEQGSGAGGEWRRWVGAAGKGACWLQGACGRLPLRQSSALLLLLAYRKACKSPCMPSNSPHPPLPRCLQGGQLITCGWEDAICINHAGGDPECKRPDALSDATAQIMGVVAIPDTGMGATADGGLGLPSLDGLTGLGITLPSLTP